MANITINPDQTVTFDTREVGATSLTLTNDNAAGDATYTISIDNGASTPHTLAPRYSEFYDMDGRNTASVENTGTLDIEASFVEQDTEDEEDE